MASGRYSGSTNGSLHAAGSGSSSSSSSSAAQANVLLATRIRINDLFVQWLSSEEGSALVNVVVSEHVAAARQPPQPLDSQMSHDSGAVGGSGSAQPSPTQHYDPHTPVTPPHHPRPARPDPNTSPQRYIDRVDELDMRSSLVGLGASPVSPNQAVRAVDPHLPRSPDVHGPRQAAAAAAAARGRMFLSPEDAMASSTAPSTGPSLPSQMQHSASSSRAASPTAAHQPLTRAASFEDIPRFFRVCRGRSAVGPIDGASGELEALNHIFSSSSSTGASRRDRPPRTSSQVDLTKTLKRSQFEQVCTDVFRVPGWMRDVLFGRMLKECGIQDVGPSTTVKFNDIKKYYESCMMNLTPNRRLFELIRSPNSKREHLTVEELAAAVRQLVTLHPCLEFLTQPEFQELYCKTVATRIVYHHERRQSRTVEWRDFDRCEVPTIMRSLDRIGDINQVLNYFSYEHFYVLYCRFWELDKEKTHRVGLEALLQYNDGALARKVLERVVQGKGHRLVNPARQELEFEDFVFFCLSEEDKNSLPAKRYWFNVLDVDEDGVISGFEMEYFFSEWQHMSQFQAEQIQYSDALCQMLDMIVPKLPDSRGVTFNDIRDCETAEHFFNMLMNASKFYMFEHRDPFAEPNRRNAFEKTAWDRFARAEYDRMAQEAGQ